jgi:hypothetical protein
VNPFPDIAPDDKWEVDFESFREEDESPDGILQVNVYDAVELLRARAGWKILPQTDLVTIRTHYKANKDSATGFTLFDFDTWPWTSVAIGTGNGSQTVFNLGAKEVQASGITIRDNGSPIGFSARLVGTGTDGQDQISLTSAPAAGHVLTADFTGRLLYTVLYRTKVWSPRHVEADLYALDLEFVLKVA